MQFLDEHDNIIDEYPKSLPQNYLNFRFGAEEWLKARKNKLTATKRWRVTTSWAHQYLSDGNKPELEPMFLSFLPKSVEKQVLLQRPDPSGWEMDENEWQDFLALGINSRVFKAGEIN